ncbi:MAG TPA: NAD-dependent epimerase/dehydratase family protein [Candidatus Paceibacterota bacterium]|jgi:UDP-glucose 4-epimerase|nr:NAD-dependent epimerase/dehydratase family protein [Candidatus Paceibacterota bacterium]
MKIIVTGGAGFIGSHVVDEYVQAGHNVVVIDNLLTGSRKNLNPRAKFYDANIRDRAVVDRIFKKERPEVVSHLAAIAEVIKSIRDPMPTLQTNVLGIVNLCLAFGAHGRGGAQRKFIFSSTGGAMYGAPRKLPATEKEDTITLSPYGLSKHLGEEVLKFYARQYNFPYFIFRYANVYGPRQSPKGEAGVIAIFGGLMKAGARPIIFGDGTKARDYVYVGDVARANLLALRRGKNDVVNIGTGKLVTDRAIFDAVARASGFKGKPIYKPYRKGELYKISLDARKAGRVLGWKPTMKFEEGVRTTVAAL